MKIIYLLLLVIFGAGLGLAIAIFALSREWGLCALATGILGFMIMLILGSHNRR